jgi:flagellar basal-body rod protein FlgF
VNQGLYSGVAAMNAAERRLDAVTSNLANINASGFKRRGTAMTTFDAVLRGHTQRQTGMRQTIDDAQGTLQPTENPYDLALVGQGFFAVEGPRGELYTRDGRFQSDSNGVLQTADGFPLAWAGARGTIDPTGKPVTIDSEGQVAQGDQKLGRLRVVDFRDHARLEALGGGFFRAPRGLAEATSTAQVRQGHLEQANVSGVDEMVELIAVQRGFESATRLLSMIDQSYRRLTTPS